ncbi:cytochrome c [Geobacter grbiciae]|uniref:cytochrome c n=1 Tax=Geobacter grbiciae TaxID=155042 RepID=UPI001FEC6881|nr:cytochrome c [Geobacter grbiciae]
MYAQVQAKINSALERGDATTVEAEAGKIAATIPDLKKAKPHKNLKKIDTFKKIADAFSSEVTATAALAKKGDLAGANAAFKKAEGKCSECHAKFRD